MSQVKIGWAMRQIAIDDNLCLFGQMYLRISQGILDPNMTTALVLDSGEGHAIFCCCDIEAHRGDSIQRTINKVVAMRPEIDPNSIIMNVTHTHTGGSICPKSSATRAVNSCVFISFSSFKFRFVAQL